VTTSGTSLTSNATTVTVNSLPFAGISIGSASSNGVPLTANTAAGSGTISSLQWFKNGIAIAGATSAALLATSDGSYLVTVFNSNGCSSSSSAVNIVVPTAQPTCTITTPTGLSTTSITSTSAVFSWSSLPACDSLLFRVRIEGSNTYIYISLAYNGQTSFVLSNLQPNKRYSWRMRTKCGGTTSSYSDRLYFNTPAASASTSRMEEPVVSVRTLVEGLVAYPNPAREHFSLRIIADEVSEAILQLTDLSGRIVMQEKVQLLEGENIHRIDLQGLTNGLYLASVLYPDEVLTTRVNVIQ